MTTASLREAKEIPVGTVAFWLGTLADLEQQIENGWLPLDGRTIHKGTYPELWTMLASFVAGGGVNTETTYTLPDFRQRYPVAHDGIDMTLGQFGGTIDHDHGSHGTHASGGAHTHDNHTTNSSGTLGSTIGNPTTHSSDGGHTHDAHSAHTAQNPPFIAMHTLVKAR